MTNLLNSKLTLENPRKGMNYINVFPNCDNRYDLVSIELFINDKIVDLAKSDDDDPCFHLDKFSVGCLIDYLKRVYDDMNDLP